MKLLLFHPSLRCPRAVASLLERRLHALCRRIRIEQAEVQLADEREASPRFRAAVLLRVPGPDLHASACDHTVGTAVAKVLALLERQTAARLARRSLRRKSNLQHSAATRTVRAW